ncbi:MAG TPA: acyl-ACP thioesterase domain-containing protein, partial [Candidatus Acidoferrum sp.]|nr:acyl-ACP thioesterase domain-containing protein [Candidatus Acidoferrum sp.]
MTHAAGDLAHDRSTWQTTYRIRFDEAGPDGLLRTSGFMRYAQDLAWQHSSELGFGRAWYAERGLTWLVRAAELVIIRAPEMGTTIAAHTAIVGIRRVFARRRGEFLLADGTPAGWVNTDWVLIDARGALTRIPS